MTTHTESEDAFGTIPELDNTQVAAFADAYARAVQAHRVSNGKAAAAVIELGKVLYTAKREMGRVSYVYFLRKTGLSAPSALKRLVSLQTIGKRADVLMPVAEHLPASITALKFLAPYDADGLAALIDTGRLNPLMTVEDVKYLAPPKESKASKVEGKNNKGTPAVYSFTLTMNPESFTPAKGRALKRTLENFIAKNGDALGLLPDVKVSVDVELALMLHEHPERGRSCVVKQHRLYPAVAGSIA